MSTVSSQDIDTDQLAGNLATLSAMSNSNPSLNTLGKSRRKGFHLFSFSNFEEGIEVIMEDLGSML